MKPKDLLTLFKDAFKDWGEDRAPILGAALAYYTIFSIGPLLVVLIAIAGFVLGDAAASGQVVDTVKSFMGEDGARMIQGMIQSASKPGAGIIASIIGIVTLLLGAMGIFGQLKRALNIIWEAPTRKGGGIGAALFQNVLSFGMVVACGFLLMVSFAVNAVLASLSSFVTSTLPGGTLLWQVVNYLVTLGVVTLLFALIFKVLPDVKIAWKDVWLGALVTAILFMLGQLAIGLYLSFANVGSAFGAAGSLVIILVWIYYSSQIVFMGAELTQVYANSKGSRGAAKRAVETEKEGGAARERRLSPWFS